MTNLDCKQGGPGALARFLERYIVAFEKCEALGEPEFDNCVNVQELCQFLAAKLRLIVTSNS